MENNSVSQTAMQEFIEYLELTYGSLDSYIKEIYLEKESIQLLPLRFRTKFEIQYEDLKGESEFEPKEVEQLYEKYYKNDGWKLNIEYGYVFCFMDLGVQLNIDDSVQIKNDCFIVYEKYFDIEERIMTYSIGYID
jgi:hypothetical protein